MLCGELAKRSPQDRSANLLIGVNTQCYFGQKFFLISPFSYPYSVKHLSSFTRQSGDWLSGKCVETAFANSTHNKGKRTTWNTVDFLHNGCISRGKQKLLIILFP